MPGCVPAAFCILIAARRLPGCMADKDGHPMLWITLGTLAAVGAGYLVWRYAMSDEQKQVTKQNAVRVAKKARATMHDASEQLLDT